MKTFKYTLSTMFITLFVAACSSDYLDINKDPNNPLSVSPDLILPVAQSYSAFIQESFQGQNSLGNFMMYNWAESEGSVFYGAEFRYFVDPSFYSQNFDYTYANALKQYSALNTLEGDEFGYYRAIGQVMVGYHFQLLVDTYGDVPYFEALQRGSNITPKYDKAEVIYDDLIVQLSSAISLINSTASNSAISPIMPGADDVMFGGDMDLWKRFANTVKLRILVRLSDLPEKAEYIRNEFAVIAGEGSGLIENDVEVQLGYINEENRMNPKWAEFGQDAQGNNTIFNNATCATPFVLNFLEGTQDPRIDFIYEKPVTGHLGVRQGQLYNTAGEGEFVSEKVSNMGPGILQEPGQAAVLYTAAESYFNQAEAALKGLMVGDAKSLYENGIQASFSYLGAGNASLYYSQDLNLVGWDTSANKQEAIITQKWLALNSIDAIQAWFDYSRTGYPSNLPISDLAANSDRPVRLAYPSSEITANGENLPAQPDAFTDKIFWAN